MRRSLGMDQNVAAMVMYLLSLAFSFVHGLVFFLLEKENKFVRFHSMQSLIMNAALIIVCILTFWTFVVPIIAGLAVLVYTIILCVKSYQNEMYKVPLVGKFADNWS